MHRITSMTSEAEVCGPLVDVCIAYGAGCLAHPPIVASGNNASIPHYIKGKSLQELLCLDMGCECESHSSATTYVASNPGLSLVNLIFNFQTSATPDFLTRTGNTDGEIFFYLVAPSRLLQTNGRARRLLQPILLWRRCRRDALRCWAPDLDAFNLADWIAIEDTRKRQCR